MGKKTLCLLALALLAGCSGNRKQEAAVDMDSPRWDASAGKPPAFALPGVPLKSEIEAASGKQGPAAPEPAAEAAAAPQAAQPAAAPAAGEEKELEFHLGAARRYAAARKYRSAAAEYGAASKFLPSGDARAVHLLERQAAMFLKAGADAKAEGLFTSAIALAGELNVSGADLANAHLGLGYCLEKAGKLPEALGNYEKASALTVNPRTKAKIDKTISDLKKTP